CRRASRRFASRSTRGSSPSWPTGAATRPSASSPTWACSSAASATSCYDVTPLPWGKRYLMCPPEHFGVVYEINPWMHREVVVDRERAQGQWDELVRTLRAAGADIELLDPHPDLPDLVFTANAGIVNGRQFVPAR